MTDILNISVIFYYNNNFKINNTMFHHNKYYFLLQICLLITTTSFAQTPIPTDFYGINGWMPDSLNTSFYNGQVHNLWTEVEASKPAVIRIGGIAYDKNYPTDYQLLKMIDSVQSIGAEPIIQVPLWAGTETAQNAADIVTLVNVTYGKNVKYFTFLP